MRFTEAPGGNQDKMAEVLGKHISYFQRKLILGSADCPTQYLVGEIYKMQMEHENDIIWTVNVCCSLLTITLHVADCRTVHRYAKCRFTVDLKHIHPVPKPEHENC